MKKKHFVTPKDKKDWEVFTKQMGDVRPKESDLLKENIGKNKTKKLDLHGSSLIEANNIVKKFIIESFNSGYKKLSHLPIVADPSHATGRWDLVTPMAFAAVAAGAHGLLIEVHPNPDKALSDGPQSLNFDNFQRLMEGVRGIAGAVGRTVAPGQG